jgi:hypothetical protein
MLADTDESFLLFVVLVCHRWWLLLNRNGVPGGDEQTGSDFLGLQAVTLLLDTAAAEHATWVVIVRVQQERASSGMAAFTARRHRDEVCHGGLASGLTSGVGFPA